MGLSAANFSPASGLPPSHPNQCAPQRFRKTATRRASKRLLGLRPSQDDAVHSVARTTGVPSYTVDRSASPSLLNKLEHPQAGLESGSIKKMCSTMSRESDLCTKPRRVRSHHAQTEASRDRHKRDHETADGSKRRPRAPVLGRTMIRSGVGPERVDDGRKRLPVTDPLTFLLLQREPHSRLRS